VVPLLLLFGTGAELAAYMAVARNFLDASWGEAALFALITLLAVRALIVAVTWAYARAYQSPAPALPAGHRLRMILGEYLAFLLTFVVVLPFERLWMPPDRLRPSARVILLVHGYGCSRGVWWWLRRRLEAAGFTVASVSLAPPYTHIGKVVPQLNRRIEDVCRDTGASQVTLVAHSMGGLVSRSYLARHGHARVERLVTIATPHYGSELARIGIGANAQEMVPGSPFLQDLGAEKVGIPAISVRTPHDNYVMPQDNQRLPGARDIELPGIGHLAVLYAPRTVAALASACR
jgi:triacylglycerol lipase